MFKKSILVFALAIFCLSCSFPSGTQVKSDFKSANPTFEPISAIVGEGDGDAAYYHISYKKTNDSKVYEQIWLYLRQSDGNFKITSKGKETVVKE